MTLSQLTRPWFLYLVEFRERVEGGAPPTLEELRQELESLFQGMEEGAKRHPSLRAPYQQVRYALVALADEVILSSQWEQAAEWESGLLELKYFGTNLAGERFFEQLNAARQAPPAVQEVYYLCLSLGFRGRYGDDPERLQKIKEELLSRLDRNPAVSDNRLAPQAYSVSPKGSARLGRLWSWRAVLLAVGGLLLAILVIDRFALWPLLTSQASQVAGLAQRRLEEPLRQPAPPAPPQPMPPASPATPPPSAAVKPAPPASTASLHGILVRVGTYVGPVDSNRLADKLRAAGYPASVVRRRREEGGWWYLVLVGPYEKWNHADEQSRAIARAFSLQPVVVEARQLGKVEPVR